MQSQRLTYFFTIALGISACDEDTTRAPIAPADVSFLLPLTVGPTRSTAGTSGRYGVLVPREHFDSIADSEPLTRVDEPDDIYANLAVVAVRLDPCFIEGLDETLCASQVRLVLQPILQLAGATDIVVRDASMHAFYDVPRSELDSLADDLAALRTRRAGPEAVGVHFAPDDAMALVLDRIGDDRLSRITHMSVHSSNEAWVFGGFNIVSGQRIDIPIPGIVAPAGAARFRFEQHLTSTGAKGDLAATLIPEPVIEADIAAFLDAPRRLALSEADWDRSLDSLDRLLDPARHNPGTVDCASCHIATTALRFATRDSDPSLVSSAYDDTRNQRMFGWFGDSASISPRVILETEAVVDRLNSLK